MARNIGLGILFSIAALLSLSAAIPWISEKWSRGSTQNADVTYICTETHEVIQAPAQPVPAINPKTNRATLVRAIYATQAGKWIPAPPEEVLRKNRRQYSANDGKSPLSLAAPLASAKKP